MLATVLPETWLVGIEIETDEVPAGIVDTAGGMAEGESLEKSITAPPVGA
jgi:hypothetical protein